MEGICIIGWILFSTGLLGDIGFIIALPRKTTPLMAAEIKPMPKEASQQLRYVKRRESLAYLGMLGSTVMLIIGVIFLALD